MSDIKIDEALFPELQDKVAIVTGGSAGIGLAACKLLLKKGATVHSVDLKEPDEEKSSDAEGWKEWRDFHVHLVDISDWVALRDVFDLIGRVDFVFANAAVIRTDNISNFLGDNRDHHNKLLEPQWDDLDVNIHGTFNTVKLAHYMMKKHEIPGIIVITGSTAMYIPDEFVPLSSAAWGSQLNLIRSLHQVVARDNITLNGVAVFAAVSESCSLDVAIGLMEKDIPVSEPIAVAKALVHAAVAQQPRRVSTLAQEPSEALMTAGRWNGRVTLVVGNEYRELEQLLADARFVWFRKKFAKSLKAQRAITESIWNAGA